MPGPPRRLRTSPAQQLPQLALQRGEFGCRADVAGARTGERRPVFGDDPARPGGHHQDAVTEHDRLFQAVGDEERGGAGGLGEVQQLVLEDRPQLGVEGRERLVHQQDFGFDGEGAGDRDALPHAAGERGRIGAGELGEAHPGEPVAGPGVGLLARDALDVEAEADIGENGLPVVDAVVLEDHRGRAVRSVRMASSPALGRSSPAAMRSRVDLPQPEGPTRQVNSPGAIVEIEAGRGHAAVRWRRPKEAGGRWAWSVGCGSPTVSPRRGVVAGWAPPTI